LGCIFSPVMNFHDNVYVYTMQGHLINHQWIPGSGTSFVSVNPATGKTVFEAYSATEKEVDAAIDAAHQASEHWAGISLESRIPYFERFRERLKSRQAEFAKAISEETGKPLWDALTEVQAMIGKIAISIEAYGQRCVQVEKEHPSGKLVTRHKPHGVIAVFGPFNFPGHLPNGHIVPALLAGNTIVFKPSEYTPLVAALLGECWQNSNLPPGVFNLIQGGKETGKMLALSPRINGLFFTGSWKTGQSLLKQYADHPEKILALEMGGNNPLVIGQVSNLLAASYAVIQSAYLSSGQRCTCARRLILSENSNTEPFLAELVRTIGRIKVGPYTDSPEPFMGPVISTQAAGIILEAQETLRKLGGRSLVEARILRPGTALLSPGLIDVTEVKARPDEELFGPFLQVIRVKDFAEALAEANRTRYGLVAGLLSDRREEYEAFYREIKAGVVNWNTPTTGASSAAPFGGIGLSGNHRPSAFYAADYCAYPVASIESETLKIPDNVIGISGHHES
jgi:succinylglutamic semialdehyde dehydrogenase